MSTSKPCHWPALSGNEKPAKPGLTPQNRMPRDFTTSSLEDCAQTQSGCETNKATIPAARILLNLMTGAPVYACQPASFRCRWRIKTGGRLLLQRRASRHVPFGSNGLERFADQVHCGVDLALRRGGRRNKAKDGAITSERENQALLKTELSDDLAFDGRGFLRLPVAHQLDARELTAAANVPDHLVALLECLETRAHMNPDFARLFGNVLFLD